MKRPKPIHGITSPPGTRPIRTWCGRILPIPGGPVGVRGTLLDLDRISTDEEDVTCRPCRRVFNSATVWGCALEGYHYEEIPDAPPLCLRCGLPADVHGHGEGGSHEASLPIEQRASHPFES